MVARDKEGLKMEDVFRRTKGLVKSYFDVTGEQLYMFAGIFLSGANLKNLANSGIEIYNQMSAKPHAFSIIPKVWPFTRCRICYGLSQLLIRNKSLLAGSYDIESVQQWTAVLVKSRNTGEYKYMCSLIGSKTAPVGFYSEPSEMGWVTAKDTLCL